MSTLPESAVLNPKACKKYYDQKAKWEQIFQKSGIGPDSLDLESAYSMLPLMVGSNGRQFMVVPAGPKFSLEMWAGILQRHYRQFRVEHFSLANEWQNICSLREAERNTSYIVADCEFELVDWKNPQESLSTLREKRAATFEELIAWCLLGNLPLPNSRVFACGSIVNWGLARNPYPFFARSWCTESSENEENKTLRPEKIHLGCLIPGGRLDNLQCKILTVSETPA